MLTNIINQEINLIKERLVNKVLILTLINLSFGLIFSLLRWYEIGFHPLYILHLTLYTLFIAVATFRKKLSLTLKTHFIGLTYTIVSIAGLYYMAHYSAFFFVLIAITFISILLEKKVAYYYSALFLVSNIFIGWLYISNKLSTRIELNHYTHLYTVWVSLSITIMTQIVILIEGLGLFYKELINAIHSRGEINNALRESEAFRQQIFESSRLPIVVIDANTNKFIDCNSAAVNIYGYKSKEQIIGLMLEDVSSPFQYDQNSTAEKTRFFIDKAKQEGSVVFEWKHQRPDGYIWDAEVHLLSFTAEGRALLQFTLIDITERKQSEGMLTKLSTSLAHLTGKSFFDAVCEDAAKIIELDFIFVGRLNPDGHSISTLGGYAKGKPMDPFTYNLEDTPCENVMGKETCAYTENIQHTFPSDHLLKEMGIESYVGVPLFSKEKQAIGIMVGLHGSALKNIEKIKQVFGIYTDRVTAEMQRNMAEQALCNSEQKARAILDQGFVFIGLLSPDGILLEANRTAMELIGVTPLDVYNKPFWESPWWNHSAELQNKIRESIKSAAAGKEVRFEASHPVTDGSLRYVDFSLRPVTNEQGDVLYLIPEGHDITERKHAEENLLESQRKLATLMGNLPGIAYRCKNDKDWTMVFLSEGCFDVTGFYPHELEDNSINSYGKLINQEDAEMVWHKVQEGLDNHSFWQIEYRIQTKEGKEKWVWEQGCGVFNDAGDLEVLEGFITDISERKKAEEALAISEEKYRFIVENAPIGIFQRTLEGQYRYCNQTLANHFECAGIEEFLHYYNETPKRWANMDEYAKFNKLLIKNGKILGFEVETRLVNGKTKWFSLFVDLDKCNSVINGFSLDITEQKKSQLELQQSEARYRFITENIGDVIWTMSFKTGKFTYVSASVEKLRGYTVEEVMNQSMEEALTPESLKIATDSIQQSIAKRKSGDTSPSISTSMLDQPCKDGSVVSTELVATIVFNEEGEPVEAIGITRDITERKQTEIQLRKLSQAVEQSPASVVITNPDGDIEYVNPKFTETTGYTLNEAKGQKPSILKSGEHTTSFYTELWQTILSGKEWRGEFHNKKKNGELYWESALISPIFSKERIITHYLAVKEDITAKKNIMRDLIIAKEKAEESDKLKTAFLQNMSHEIRTPMNAIMGFSSLLAENVEKKEVIESYAKIITQRSNDLLDIINDVLDISKIESGYNQTYITKCNINELFNELETIFSQYKLRVNRQNVTIQFHTLDKVDTPTIWTDKQKLMQILINLISNAFKFSDSGKIDCGYELKSNKLQFYISDSGVGIPHDKQEYIFERFARIETIIADKYVGGTGLGLAISKSLVKLLGGDIWLKSELGKGTTFFFTICNKPL